ncbi:chromate transporter [Pelobium manganitolerans]|uniref:Chromate transporter n=2 Tax=Pelobium manganitolerans TaxID=1842495 RepID=A0A419S4E2_9SPHI|nr:chromate transporter [Pelobium manganitolerans]
MLTSFGGPQAHLAILLNDFVKKRAYLSEEELMELYALTQILPGPSSTQTVVGVAYKVGGLSLAILTFLIWAVPAAAVMCFIAINLETFSLNPSFSKVLQFIQPIALGIVAYATYAFGKIALKSQINIILATGAAAASLILRSPFVFPILILLGGIVSSATEAKHEEDQIRVKLFSSINTKKVAYFIGVMLVFGLLGAIVNRTSPFSLPIRLFENFYRNGIIIFGGGQVLVPLMYTEFVDVKHYLTGQEFLSGYALQQMIPGPTFSFTSFVGAMSLGNRGYGVVGQMMGSAIAVLGINAPGLILILFIVPFWEDLKKINRIKSSLNGINAVAVGFMFAAFWLLIKPVGFSYENIAIMLATFLTLKFTKVKTPYIILVGVLAGILLS